MEILSNFKGFKIINIYANKVYSKNNLNPYYGDIYTSKEELLKDHPNAEIMEGFNFVDEDTNLIPEFAPDWFYEIEEVKDYIRNL